MERTQKVIAEYEINLSTVKKQYFLLRYSNEIKFTVPWDIFSSVGIYIKQDPDENKTQFGKEKFENIF